MIQVFKQREDKTIDFYDSLIVDVNEIPDGYIIPDKEKYYKSDGTEMSAEELEAIQNNDGVPNQLERLEALEDAMLELLIGGDSDG